MKKKKTQKQNGEAQSMISLDSQITQLAGKFRYSSETLWGITQYFDLSERTGNAVKDKLEKIVNNLLKDKILMQMKIHKSRLVII